MQNFINRLKTRLMQARKKHDEVAKSILTVALGEIEYAAMKQKKPLEEKDCHSIIRKIIQGNNETLECVEQMKSEGGKAKTSDDIDRLLQENDILENFLPELLSQGEIEKFLAEVDSGFSRIREAKNEGQAMGLAMRALNAANKSVNGNDVKAVVTEVRNRC